MLGENVTTKNRLYFKRPNEIGNNRQVNEDNEIFRIRNPICERERAHLNVVGHQSACMHIIIIMNDDDDDEQRIKVSPNGKKEQPGRHTHTVRNLKCSIR